MGGIYSFLVLRSFGQDREFGSCERADLFHVLLAALVPSLQVVGVIAVQLSPADLLLSPRWTTLSPARTPSPSR